MCEQTTELCEGVSDFLGSAARLDEFHCQDLSAIQTLSQWAALFVESLLELLFSLQVVLQRELAGFGHRDEFVPLWLSLHKHRSPAGQQECGLILFWLTPVKMGACIAKTIGASSGSKESSRLQTGLNHLSGKGLCVLQALQYWFQHCLAGAEAMPAPGGVAVALAEGKTGLCPLWNHKSRNVISFRKFLKRAFCEKNPFVRQTVK